MVTYGHKAVAAASRVTYISFTYCGIQSQAVISCEFGSCGEGQLPASQMLQTVVRHAVMGMSLVSYAQSIVCLGIAFAFALCSCLVFACVGAVCPVRLVVCRASRAHSSYSSRLALVFF